LFNQLSFRIVFKDRQNAGQILGDNLKKYFKSQKNFDSKLDNSSVLVVGIPRGGLIVADQVATKLNCDLDFIYPIRIVGADNETTLGSILFVEEALSHFQNFQTDNYGNKFLINLNNEGAKEYVNFNKWIIDPASLERSKEYSLVSHKLIHGKIVILVDDGVYSGASALTALQWIRIHQPKKLIFATPVAPKNVIEKLMKDSNISLDHLEILKSISPKKYRSVNYYYSNFEDVNDPHINKIMQKKVSN
jgi:putative phosphoribosyl transferase